MLVQKKEREEKDQETPEAVRSGAATNRPSDDKETNEKEHIRLPQAPKQKT